jgi:hypothetical protein
MGTHNRLDMVTVLATQPVRITVSARCFGTIMQMTAYLNLHKIQIEKLVVK